MRELPEYPWEKMTEYAALAAKHPAGKIDLSIGSPIDEVPESVQKALALNTNAHFYPTTVGTPELREAIASWFLRRRAVEVAPEACLPTVGSKELVALLPFLLGIGKGDAVVYPEIAYPTYEMGAVLCGAAAIACDEPENWPANTKLVWLNSPANPHGRVLSVAEMRQAVARARELGAVIVSDECYAELGWEEPYLQNVPSILSPEVSSSHTGLLCAYSLSKQSNMAGLRAAFIAGDQDLIKNLANVRKHAGMIVPYPVQQAMIAALNDDAATKKQVAKYRARRQILLPALQAAGWCITDSEAGLYLWATKGADCWQGIKELAEIGIVAGPGEFYGKAGQNFVRFALSASDAQIAEAAARLTKTIE